MERYKSQFEALKGMKISLATLQEFYNGSAKNLTVSILVPGRKRFLDVSAAYEPRLD